MSSNASLAPILISVYNRYIHFRKCIESFKKNYLADKSHLFVVFDAPSREEHVLDNKKVIEYAKTIKGFKNITLLIRDKNIGAHKNVLKAIQEVFNKYPKLIFSEDDNIFAPTFLSFINQGLEIYKDREDIFSISGYNYPVKICNKYPHDIYIWTGFSAWGVGLWKDKWNQVDFEMTDFGKIVNNNKIIKKLNNFGEHLYSHMVNNFKTKGYNSVDNSVCYHNFKNNIFTVFPVISRVRNIGIDGSGHNQMRDKNNIYSKQQIYTGNQIPDFPFDIKPDPRIFEILRKHFKIKLKTKIKKGAKNILGYLRLYNK